MNWVEMELIINGEKKEVNCNRVSDLLNALSLNKDTVAVELNKNIVHHDKFNNTKLKNNDILEIVRIVGGG